MKNTLVGMQKITTFFAVFALFLSSSLPVHVTAADSYVYATCRDMSQRPVNRVLAYDVTSSAGQQITPENSRWFNALTLEQLNALELYDPSYLASLDFSEWGFFHLPGGRVIFSPINSSHVSMHMGLLQTTTSSTSRVNGFVALTWKRGGKREYSQLHLFHGEVKVGAFYDIDTPVFNPLSFNPPPDARELTWMIGLNTENLPFVLMLKETYCTDDINYSLRSFF